MSVAPLTVAWFSQFPLEWLPDAPAAVQRLPREHPSSWQRVLLEELEQNPGVRLHVIVLRKKAERDFTYERNGVTFHLLRARGGLGVTTLFWRDTWLIRRKLKQIKPDVVHAWGTERGGALIANRLGYPAVVTIQGLLSWYQELVPLNWHDRLTARLERYSLPRARLVSTESTFSVNWLRARFPGLRVEQAEHAPAKMFHTVVRQPQTHPLRFLFVGSFDHRKGADLLVTALEHLRNELMFELIVVGNPEPGLWKNLQPHLSADLRARIQFKPNLPPAQVAEELARATMLVFPTRADTSPNSVKEAAVAGVPVVASAVGGITDYIWPGRNGILFPAGDAERCAQAIREACGHRLFGNGQVEAGALAEARNYLAPQRMGEAFLKIYRELGRAGERR